MGYINHISLPLYSNSKNSFPSNIKFYNKKELLKINSSYMAERKGIEPLMRRP